MRFRNDRAHYGRRGKAQPLAKHLRLEQKCARRTLTQELRWLYDRRDLDEAKADLAACLGKWSVRYPRLTSWVEETIEQTLR